MREDTRQLVDEFLKFLKEQLGVSDIPEVQFVGKDFSDREHSFGQYDGNEGSIKVVLKGRHPMDVLRTIAHEVVHRVKNHTDGADGSPDENEANAMAGEFMRKFGKVRKDGFGFLPEGTVRAFFEAIGPYPEGFEQQNQGVTRRAPGEGPDSTADAQEMVATDRGGSTSRVTWNPGEFGADIERVLGSMHMMDPLRSKLKSAGPYAQIELQPAESQELQTALTAFMGGRVYSKPDVEFAKNIVSQLGSTGIHENISGRVGDGEGFDIARMEREPSSQDYSEQQFSHPPQEDYELTQMPNGFIRVITPGGNEQVFSDMEKAVRYRDWHQSISKDDPSLTEMFFFEDIASMKRSVEDMKRSVARLDKESSKEKKEHPWMSDRQAKRVAKDHTKKEETQMERVFRRAK